MEIETSKPPLQQKKSGISWLAEEFLWIGGSIVAPPDMKIGQIVERCMSSMQAGTQMIKLRGSSKGLVRFYYLDEHKSCIRWRPSRKNEKAKISIDSIQEVCEGKQSEIFQRYADGSFDPNCCFSIYYGDHMESLDLVSSSGEEARTWITGLKYLMAGISDEDSLSKRQRTRDQWLKQTFDEADKNGDSNLSINEVLQLMHKMNVNLPRQKVKQMFKVFPRERRFAPRCNCVSRFQPVAYRKHFSYTWKPEEADTDDNQGTLDFDEFCAFYKMMSTRRDLYLLMLTYSNHKDHLDIEDLKRFLEVEQKMANVTKEYCLEVVDKFEPCTENKNQVVMGIDGFTNYMRSPAGDIFNPVHHQVNQDMNLPLSNYFIASSHNTYLTGDQLMSQSRVDMYAWVLQAGCRCVEVDCWDGPDGEPIVHHGYTLTSKILFKDVIETINKYAFSKNEFPVILSIENHCSVVQQKKMAQYLVEVLGDKLNLSSVYNEDLTRLPSPESLKGKILVKGKKLPANISADAEEGEVSDEDSADEIDDDCKLMNGDASTNRKQVENIAKKKLDSLLKESKIRDCEDPNNFTVSTLPAPGKLHQKPEFKKKSRSAPAGGKSMIKADDDLESSEEIGTHKRHSRSLMGSFSKRKKKGGKFKTSLSVEEGEDSLDRQGSMGRGTIHYSRITRQKKTMKLSRALSDLVKYTKSVGIHDVESEISCSWQVSSFSETKAHQVIQQKPAQYIRFNQSQLSRIYPSSYRVDSSNYNPQPFWNEGCQMVALNYQSEGRMLQLNRAKFSANGNCGYVLKPKCMCQGGFNPNSDDPLPGQLKKQLVLRIISGQQLPKPKDSMLGDRGEIIDPFVEVEIIGLPVDCLKEQTRVVDDNGFNPMWEETLVFTVHMPEITLIRFLVWDHDPIGRDFIGQRTIAFSSMMPGYRHVYLEGMEEASVFVHVAINEVSGKAKQVMGLKGLFHRNPKQASLDSHAVGHLHRKHSFSSHILRRTASAPTKGQLKNKKGFPEIAIDTKDNSSEGASEDRELDDSSLPRFDTESESAFPGPTPGDSVNGEPSLQGKGLKGKAYCCGKGKSPTRFQAGLTFSDPIRRSERVRLREPPSERPGVFARCAMNGSGRIGMATNCMKCMIGSKESPDLECKWSESASWPIAKDVPQNEQYRNKAGEERIEMKCYSVTDQPRRQPPDLLPYRSCENTEDLPKNAQSSVAPAKKNGDSKCLGGKANNRPKWQCQSGGRYGSTVNLVTAGSGSISSNSSSLESLGSPEFSTRWPENSRRQASTLQREMNALFVQKLEEIRSKSPIFFAGIHQYPILKSVSSLCSLETITEEPTTAKGKTCTGPCLAPPVCPTWGPRQGSPSSRCKVTRAECTSPFRQLGDLPSASNGPIGLASMVEVKSPNPTTLEMPIGLECNNRIEGHATDRNGNLLPYDDSIEKSNSIVHTQAVLDNSAPGEASQDCKVAAQTDKVTMRVKNISQPSNEKLNAMHEQPQHNSLQLNKPLLQAAHINPTTKGPIAHQCLSQNGPRILVRRSKSEGHVTSATMPDDGCQSPEAEVYYDATVNDQIWSKLDAGNHRDSMSSSSSMSSNDTVIDISLPNLARKSLPDLESSHLENFDSILVKNGMRPRSATTSGEEMLMVSKSKSNPNLKCNQPRTDELRPRPLAKGDEGSVPPMMTRRHTWSRLYMESLKQSSSKVRVVEDKSSTNQTKSKSLGDLTSDDISCNFESKYRSISRSFLPRSLRAQRQPPHTRSPTKPQDDLTEQLRKLTSFQQENDITSPTGFEPTESEEDGLFLLRRTSSRSQSRVRYIANRAKQAQERQRLQSLSQVNGTPIEERGNPEGACSVSKGTCTDSVSPPALGTQAKSEGDLIRGTDVFFMLKL